MRTLVGVGCTLVASVAFGLLGCSSSSSSPSAQSAPIGSQPSNKVANTLTPSEATQVCQEIAAYSASSLKGTSCVVAGISMAAFMPGSDPKATCQSAYNQCIQQPIAPDAGTDNCATASSQLSGCTATVGQINQCVADDITAFKAAYASLNCDLAATATATDAGIPTPTITVPASCTSLQSVCPNFSLGNSASGA